MEQQRRYCVAARWLGTYADESGTGPLVEESLGRLISAHDRCGNKKQARAAARRYLDRFKDGIFATLARSVLRQPE